MADRETRSDGVTAIRYHEESSHTPANVRASDHELDFGNKPTPYKRYVDRPALDLPDVPEIDAPTLDAITAETAGERESAPSLSDLTAVLHHAAGVTKRIDVYGGGERAYRAAACTGALYHVDLYVVCGDLDGLEAGVYHYDPEDHALDVLREGDHRGGLAAASGDAEDVAAAPATVVATSTWWRNAWKYRTRTYRHAFWDSGTVLANLLAAARGRDLGAAVEVGFADDRVAGLLGVDPDHEAPLELVPLGGGDPVPEPRSVASIDPETEPLSEAVVEYDLVQDAYHGSALPDGDAAAAWRARTAGGDGDPVPPAAPPDGERVSLDPVGPDVAAGTPLTVTVRRRGSCREYERDAVSFRKFSTVLDRATRGPPMTARDADGPALQYTDCYVLASAIDGLDAGVYRYRPDDGDLVRCRAGLDRSEAGHLALDQALGADAAANVYFLADLDAVTEQLGDRGYRVAQAEAALTAGRLYLGAYAHRDLGATGLTFYDSEVRTFFEPWADGAEPMFLWTCGRPA
ncbi:MAG: SagB family peptide dehydrogenase [Halobacteriaceae archaeon]